MTKLINLAALQNYPLRRGNPGCDEVNANPHFLNGIESILEFAEGLPTIDPVRHARWEYFKDTGMWGCSECKARITRNSWDGEDPFCRNCGARMDAEDGAAHD